MDTYPAYAVVPPPAWINAVVLVLLVVGLCAGVYVVLTLVAPVPRPPRSSEKQFISVLSNGKSSKPEELPCWMDKWQAKKKIAKQAAKSDKSDRVVDIPIDEAELFMSVVVPAFNEEERLTKMLDEAVEYLQKEYGTETANMNGTAEGASQPGWEMLIVSDGSTDATIQKALDFAHKRKIPEGTMRVIQLEENRGKGGAVTHGMRHVRGEYVIFADADGASKFSDLDKLVQACRKAEDDSGRGIAIGSRAHLVGSEAVVKRSKLRNFLMHSFHLLLRLMTPEATAAIKDTQCGFKLFSRSTLPHIIPYMHSEGWIFDVEMLMLAESAGIPMIEVPVGWKEVGGSKLNVLRDSLGMAWSLAVLRAAWLLEIYKRD